MIRKALSEDAFRLAEIQVFGWRNAYKNIVPDFYLFKILNVQQRIEEFKTSIIESREETYVYDDGIIKAFLTIGNCRDEDKDNNTFELWGIYVEPSFMRQGIGKKLLVYCEQNAFIRNKKEITLWVLKENKIGINFYRKYDYQPDGNEKIIPNTNIKEIRFVKTL